MTSPAVFQLATAIHYAGGRAYVTGGAVRDLVLGIGLSKDYDLEVYGLEWTRVAELATKFGKVTEAGRFAVLKLTTPTGEELDISLPRKDSKTGPKHTDFAVISDPNMSFAEACRRRDFTMNSMLLDPLNGHLVDLFSGRKDIANRVLRVVDPTTFADDPLRVLRAMQFVARFNLTVDPKSLTIMRPLVPSIIQLSRERFFTEWQKLLLSSMPSVGLQFALEVGLIDTHYPELLATIGVMQKPKYHPEGDVWNHTLLAVNKAAVLTKQYKLSEDDAMTIMLGTLCHDLGKPASMTVVDGDIRFYDHHTLGMEPAASFLKRIGLEHAPNGQTIRAKVLKLVEHHMFGWFAYKGAEDKTAYGPGAYRRLARKLHPATFAELALVLNADGMAMRGQSEATHMLKMADAAQVTYLPREDVVTGKDLLRLGFKEGRQIGGLIALCNEMSDSYDLDQDELLKLISSCTTAEKAIELLTLYTKG